MKTYEKPVLMALSLNANDQLCGTCADNGASILLYSDSTTAGLILRMLNRTPEYDGIAGISRGDFAGIFGTEDFCATPSDQYCKFTGSNLVAWS